MKVLKIPVFASEREVNTLRNLIAVKDWGAVIKDPTVYRFLESVEQRRYDNVVDINETA